MLRKRVGLAGVRSRCAWCCAALLLTLAGTCFASEKAHLVIVAIDDSGSMKRNDPGNMRLEAAEMLATSGSTVDRVGIVRFGNDASWLLQPAPLPKGQALSPVFAGFTSNDEWTNFARVFQVVHDYAEAQQTLLTNYDVSLVLITDGAADPGPQAAGGAEGNRDETMRLARSLRARGLRVFTIGLGATAETRFLEQLAAETGGFYTPTRTAGGLRDAFLRTVTRIFSLPAYAQVQGENKATVRVGSTPDLVRAYLFRETAATTLQAAGNPFFSSQHVAAYDLPASPEAGIRLAGPVENASVVVCVRQPLSFREDRPVPPVLLVDSTHDISLELVAGAERQWERLFMRDAAVQLRLHSANGGEIVQPLYPDNSTRSYKGSVPTQRIGEYEATVRMESPYGAITYFVAKLKIAATAVDLPAQATVKYPAFLPAAARRWFGADVPVKYALPVGAATVDFDSAAGVQLARGSIETAPGRDTETSIYAADGTPSGNVAVPYTVTWSNNGQKQVRRSTMSVQVVPQSPVDFAGDHWLALGLSLIVLVGGYLLRPPAHRVTGILVIDRPDAGRTRILLTPLKAKTVLVRESASGEDLRAVPVVVRGDADRDLFALTMARVGGAWVPRIERCAGVPLETPGVLKQGCKIAMQDRDLTFTYYAG